MKRLCIILLLLSWSFFAFAGTYAPLETIANNKTAQWNAQLTVDMLHWLHKVLNEHGHPTQQDIDHFFAKNATYQFGSKVEMHSHTGYWKQITNLAEHIQSMKRQINEVIAVGDKTVIWYDISVVLKNKQKVSMHIISIFTVKHHKITSWVKMIDSQLLYM